MQTNHILYTTRLPRKGQRVEGILLQTNEPSLTCVAEQVDRLEPFWDEPLYMVRTFNGAVYTVHVFKGRPEMDARLRKRFQASLKGKADPVDLCGPDCPCRKEPEDGQAENPSGRDLLLLAAAGLAPLVLWLIMTGNLGEHVDRLLELILEALKLFASWSSNLLAQLS